jgi:hypothetical protein
VIRLLYRLPWYVLEGLARKEFDVVAWIGPYCRDWGRTAAGPAPGGVSLPDWWTVAAEFLGALADPIGYPQFSFRRTDSYVRGIGAGLRSAWEVAQATDPDLISR